MPAPRIALVTTPHLPDPDFDMEPLLRTLRAKGAHVEPIDWHAPDRPLDGFDLAVIRSPWDYYLDQHEAFLAFLDDAATRTTLLNPPAVVRENIHKGYLLELEAAGLPVVPTKLIRTGNPPALDAAFDRWLDWEGGVVKPAVGAGSHKTRRFTRDRLANARAFAAELSAKQDTLVQPLMPGFADPGERALIWFPADDPGAPGTWTHAVRKHPRFDHQDESVTLDHPITDDERRIAEAAIAPIKDDLLYARVDVIQHEGQTLISEVELIEPSLFLYLDGAAHALDRFTDLVIARTTRPAAV